MSRDKQEDGKELICFREYWTESVPASEASAAMPSKAAAMLLFMDTDDAAGQAAAVELSLENTLIIVRSGGAFQRLGEHEYTIRPSTEQDYTAVLADAVKEQLNITCAVMLWKNSAMPEEAEDTVLPDTGAMLTVFHWIQAFHALKLRLRLRWLSIARSGAAVRPGIAALGAYGRSLQQVYPRLRFTHIELQDEAKPLAAVIREEALLTRHGLAHAVRYRKHCREELQFRELALSAAGPVPLKQGGVYMISGGAGGLGMILGAYLAERWQAKLILLGRRLLTSSIRDQLAALRLSGGDALYLSCDVSDPAAVRSAVREAKRHYGSLNGVIHAAGQESRELIFQKSTAAFIETLQPKVAGIAALDEATQHEPLDFFTAFSSTSALFGDFGQCDYALANRFLDRYLRLRQQRVEQGKRRGSSISMNWPLWEAGGMHLEEKGEQLYLQTSGMGYLPTALGISAFESILAGWEQQAALVYGVRASLESQLGLMPKEAVQAKGGIAKVEERTENIAGSLDGRVMHDVLQLAAHVLQIQPGKLSPEENLGDFGFDSISLKEFADALSGLYDIELSPAVFFAKTTLDELVPFLLEEFRWEVEDHYAAVPVPDRLHRSAGSGIAAQPPELPEQPELLPLAHKFSSRGKSGRSKNTASQPNALREVAVIGMSFKLPGADTADELWQLLERQENQVREIPAARWDWKDYYSTDPLAENRTNSRWGGFISGHDTFDAKFFQLSPREAELMDPQHRLYIQAVWKAVEDSGTRMSTLAGKSVGVFSGVQFNDYQQLLSAHMDRIQAQSSTGNATALLSNRISYLFNFKGPSETIDTACSSSLVALHRAVKSIQHGESSLALAGGVSLMLDPNTYVGAGVMGVFSPEGQCRTFDRSANGYVKGEGVGVVLLKPLDQAVADGDLIYGIIKGTAVNHGGRGQSLTAPNSDAQAELVVQAFTESGVDPAAVAYIEAHGTGTELGDPVEVNGLKKAFSELYRRRGTAPEPGPQIGLGALKSNIGHLEPASGIAGVIKVLLSLSKGRLPGNLHFKELNPYIQLEGSPFYVLQHTVPWDTRADRYGRPLPRCAGVSSFGFGGTNAHAVIEEYLPSAAPARAMSQPVVFLLSAKSAERLREYAARFRNVLTETADLRRIAYTLQTGREELEERLAIVAATPGELQDSLAAYCSGNEAFGLYTGGARLTRSLGEHADYSPDKIALALAAADYAALARAWTTGARVAWHELYGNRLPEKLSLPGYPFAETRYWMPLKPAAPGSVTPAASGMALHALIDRNMSTLYEQMFTKTYQGNEFYLADHGHVLPGVVYLEMVRAAGALADPRQTVTGIRDVVWSSPVVADKEAVQVSVSLQPGPQGLGFRICSGEGGDQAEHAQGVLELGKIGESEQERMDIRSIMERSSGGGQEAHAYYELLRSLGAGLGSRFSGIQALYCNASEALSRLGVPDNLRSTLDDYQLHPTLTDGGLQSAVAYAYQTGRIDRQVLYVPFVLGRLEILEASVQPAYAYVQCSPGQSLRFDITFLSEAGQVVSRMKELTLRPFQVNPAALDAAADWAQPEPAASDLVYLAPSWVESATEPLLPQAPAAGAKVLVMSAPQDGQLDQAPELVDASIRVTFGAAYSPLGGNRFQIDPSNPQSYTSLAEACGIAADTRLQIVCLLGSPGSRTVKERIDQEVYPVFYLCQWLAANRFLTPVRLLCVYRNGSTVAEYSALAGFLRSAALENSRLQGSLIHIKAGGRLDSILTRELSSISLEHEVKYEADRRYVRELVPGRPVEGSSGKLITRGAYIITGGLGGLGYRVAEHLAVSVQARLLLCGRSSSGDPARLERLKALGAESAEYLQLDLADEKAVERAVSAAKSKYNRLDGVIHCAGVIKDSLLAKKRITDIAEVLNPKVYGTVHLYRALSRENPELLFLPFSSSTALIGNIGQSDYAYANSFMDHYVAQMNEKRGRSDTAVNWSLWENGGMQVDSSTRELLWSRFGMAPLSDECGLQALEDSLSFRQDQVMVAAGDKKKIIAAFTGYGRTAKQNRQKQMEYSPVISKDKDYSRLLEAELIGMMADILKSDRSEVSRDADLSGLGFDSISFTELANTVNRRWGTGITPTLFFEQSTPAEIAEAIYGEYPAVLESYCASAEPGGEVHQTPVKQAEETGKGLHAVPAYRMMNGQPYTAAALAPSALPDGRTNAQVASREPIAIVGMSGMMPGADNLEQFWSNLEARKELVTTIPQDRWSWQDRYGDPRREAGRTDVKYGAFLKRIDTFDPLFFGISPAEAEKMDPQERHMLMTVWHTLENAGYRPEALAGTRTSVFIGVSNGDYQELLLKEEIATTLTRTMLTNRISYFFNWSGPSEPVDTACSSSLVAIHRAVESIWHDGCPYAVAGGINLIASPNLFIAGGSLGMLSKDGKCKTFDKDADGYVRGEGAGALLLKPLSAAVRDKDYIHGVIRGTAVNHGGKANSITSPNAQSQAEVIIRAHEAAGIDPSTITYIETHGTGTSLGDPIEVEGLKKAFKALYLKWGKPENERPQCVIGSVKTAIGHLESAAGIAGVSKVLLSMKHGIIPGNLHFQELNPYIRLEDSGLRIAAHTAPWQPLSGNDGCAIPRRAGISAFGVGGSNAHIILEEYRNPPAGLSGQGASGQIIVLSAKSRNSLKENARRLRDFIARSNITEPAVNAFNAGNDACSIETGLQRDVTALFRQMMMLDAEDIDLEAGLEDYGLDAVKTVQLMELLKDKFNLEFKDTVYGFSSLNSLVMFLQQHDPAGIRDYYAAPHRAVPQELAAGRPGRLLLEQLAYGLQTGRAGMTERLAIVTDSLDRLHTKLEAFLSGRSGQPGVYEGQSSGQSAIGRLFEGEESRLFMNELLSARKLDKLAELWVQGVNIDWTVWYPQPLYKIPLPEYAFDEERYWLPGPDRLGIKGPLPRPEAASEAVTITEEEQETLDDDQLLMWLNKVHSGEISAENLNLLVGDLLE
ncbi:SDR family NAD(P)-dependent oxidoreductase [Paenibacillus piscarius]|uniref:SDR family NAD(P)-dependent oxidoreductase n=1 Tax=Paenibacillus piscarius TaxID=1089681 RepID=UPI001EE787B1|nr:SDR family NAD(P)-dependent oxidoreductase [Paenibacillus piscarius]